MIAHMENIIICRILHDQNYTHGEIFPELVGADYDGSAYRANDGMHAQSIAHTRIVSEIGSSV
eukprot:4847704-Amphidinium_carterae.1